MVAYTANFSSVQAAADRALDAPSGITIRFTVERHGSLAQCEHLARGFQKSFSSIRARARRISRTVRGESATIVPIDTMAHGPYDGLVCQRSRLPDDMGWSVGLYPASVILDAMDIIDNDTGRPITEIGANRTETNAILDRMGHGAVTADDWARLKELDPDLYTSVKEAYALAGKPNAVPRDPLAELDLDSLSDFGQDDTDTTEDQS
jgi:hypothetical protein